MTDAPRDVQAAAAADLQSLPQTSSMNMNHLLLPAEMMAEDRWVLWKYVDRGGKPAKVPYQPNGAAAKTNDPSTWTSYARAQEILSTSDVYSGVGFVLGDGWAGVDLDDVIVKGETKPWAEDLITSLGSYSEISPSGSGVKVFVKGDFPDAGRNAKTADGSGVEVYCQGRYFTVTGDHYGGSPRTVNESQAALHDIRYRFYSDGLEQFDDAFASMKRRLEEMPESVAGDNGSNATFHAACEIVRWGFDDEDGMRLLEHYNERRCIPQWSEAELKHKWKSAKKAEERKAALPAKPTIPRTPFGLNLLDDVMFDCDKTFEQKFLIEGLIVEKEPLILGGPQKTAKTSLLVDIAVSLANGVPCLGYFEVPEPQPVIVISGESGGATLQKTARRIRKARGVGLNENLYWGLRLPNLSLREHLDVLRLEIEQTGAKLVAIDPAYLALLSGDNADGAKNVMFMGTILNAFGQVGKDTGAALLLVHHFNKQIKQGQSPGLSNLSQSGFAEWARQWILLNHNKPYSRGEMELRVNVGGSAGHGSNYLWRISQGQQVSEGVGWTDWGVKVEDLDAPDFVVETPITKAISIVRDKLTSKPEKWHTKSQLYNQSPTFRLEHWPHAERWLRENAESSGSGHRRQYRAKPDQSAADGWD